MLALTDGVVIPDRVVQMAMRDLYYRARRSASLVANRISSESSHRLRAVIGFAESASELDLGELDGTVPHLTVRTSWLPWPSVSNYLDQHGGRPIAFSNFEPSAYTLEPEDAFFSFSAYRRNRRRDG
jgi:hypothetical protein